MMEGRNHQPQSVAERIAQSGLFDSDFYVATYGEQLVGFSSPIEHFLEIGLAKGYLPSAKFDPVLYRMLSPSCGHSNPVLHFLDNCNGSIAPTIDTILPKFSSIAGQYGKGSFSPISLREHILLRIIKKIWRWVRKSSSQPDEGMLPDAERNSVYATQMAQERCLEFVVGDQMYSLLVPQARFFFDRIQADIPFAFARLPHGFWETMITRGQIEKSLEDDLRTKNLTTTEITALATRIGSAFFPRHGGFVEDFMDEVLKEISSSSGNPDFFRSIAFKGYPTWDEKLFRECFSEDEEKDRLLIMAQFFDPREPLYDASLWKRYLISGDLKELPELCRHRHVILVASDIFSDLGQRWSLSKFSHITILRALSQRNRWDLLGRIKKVVDAVASNPGPRPIVLTQCGGALAFWLISRLFQYRSDVFYIDLGQALNGWFFDSKDLTEHNWSRIYKHAVVKNCALESYYLNRGCEDLIS